MIAELIHQEGDTITLQIQINLSGSLMEAEERILEGVNEAGKLATQQAIERFDTDGSPIRMGDVKWTRRTASPKGYQTPYGEVTVIRNVYQTSQGGRIYCPLEQNARIIRHATPRFARQLSHKYAQMHVHDVCKDLQENHGRKIAASYVQNVADWVGGIACAKEEYWAYHLPPLEEPVAAISLSLDGAHIPMKAQPEQEQPESGYRQAMVGTLSLYNPQGERLHTIYLGEAPEYGKATFTARMDREIERIKAVYPKATYLGIADGAADNWSFLERHTDHLLLDFYHASEYLTHLAQAAYPGKTNPLAREQWLQERSHQLKHTPDFVTRLIEEAEKLWNKRSLGKTVREDLQRALTYFKNQSSRMDYPGYLSQKLPIGSGVTEAACKVLVKQRLCGSGMRWKSKGAQIVLTLRALGQTAGRWEQFWNKVDQWGATPCW